PGRRGAIVRVLIIGGAGYIGSVCGAHLAGHGHVVGVLDDLSTGRREAAPGPLVVADVRDRDTVASVLRDGQYDAVLHCAARAVVHESVEHRSATFWVNVGGTSALVEAMLCAGVKAMVFSSSCAVYGQPRHLPLTEDHPQAPVSPYGESK